MFGRAENSKFGDLKETKPRKMEIEEKLFWVSDDDSQ